MADTAGGAFVGFRPQRAAPRNEEASSRLAALLRGFMGEEQPETSVLDPTYQSAKEAGNIGRIAGLASDMPNPLSMVGGTIVPVVNALRHSPFVKKMIPKATEASDALAKGVPAWKVWQGTGIDEVIDPFRVAPRAPLDNRLLGEVPDTGAAFQPKSSILMGKNDMLDQFMRLRPDATPQQVSDALKKKVVKPGQYKLSELVHNPNLYAAHPDIAKHVVNVSNEMGTGQYGKFSPSTKESTIHPAAMYEGDALETLLHEPQHFLFDQAGMPPGTASSVMKLNIPESAASGDAILKYLTLRGNAGDAEAAAMAKVLRTNDLFIKNQGPHAAYMRDTGERYAQTPGRRLWEGYAERPSTWFGAEDPTSGTLQHGFRHYSDRMAESLGKLANPTSQVVDDNAKLNAEYMLKWLRDYQNLR